MRRLVFVFAALLTGAAVRAHAQPSGVLAGTVHTSEGTPVPNLVLVVHGPDAARTVVTGPEGRYRVTGRSLSTFHPEHVEKLANHAIGKQRIATADDPTFAG